MVEAAEFYRAWASSPILRTTSSSSSRPQLLPLRTDYITTRLDIWIFALGFKFVIRHKMPGPTAHSPLGNAKSTSPHVSLFTYHCRVNVSQSQVGFYKNFGRPIAKVFFAAVFVYQGVYWLWLKLETEEIKAKKQSEKQTSPFDHLTLM